MNAPAPSSAFYCVADRRYFLGAVAMINSLRLQGHEEPIHILDCGLDALQRELLSDEAQLIPAPVGIPPYLLKTIAPMAHPAEVMVLIDVDMVATKNLSELIDDSRRGAVLAFANDTDRFVPEWGEVLELGVARPRPYVSSGLIVLGGSEGMQVLRLLDDRQRRVDFARTFYGRNDATYPFIYPEQDVLNAILCTRPEPERAVVLEHRLAPNQPFKGLRLLSERTLRCAYADGSTPFVLHHYLRKPWLEPMYHGIYSRLLARLLLGEDVSLRVAESEVPLRMRPGPLAWLERKRVDIPDLIGWWARGLLPRSAIQRVDERRRRRLAPRA